MNLREKSKFTLCVFTLILTISMPALWGCRTVMLGDNTQIAILTWLTGQNGIMPFAGVMHGALKDGEEELVIYTSLEDTSQELMVWNPTTQAGVTVSVDESTAAALIKTHYLTVHPGDIPKPGDAVTFQYPAGDTLERNPELHIEVFTQSEGPGTLHTYELAGHAADGHDSIYISSMGSPLEYVGAGRSIVVREADLDDDTSPEVGSTLENLSDNPSSPAVVYDVLGNFSITVDEPLGMIYAVAYGNSATDTGCTLLPNDDCYDASKGIIFNVSYVEEDSGDYTYHLVQLPNHKVIVEGNDTFTFGELEYDKSYVLLIAQDVDNSSDNWDELYMSKIQKGSQDMSGNILVDSDHYFGDDIEVSDIIGGSTVYYNVIPYFFVTDSTP